MRIYVGAQTGQAPHESGRDNQAVGLIVGTAPLRVLLSYYYFREHDVAKLVQECFGGVQTLDLFCDSGAYSAATMGEAIDVGQYCEWVNRWAKLFTAASAPDVIGDAEATHRATTRMQRAVKTVPVLPVFHVREDWKYLKRMVKAADYIALGGMVPYSRQRGALEGWLSQAFSIIPPTVKVHGFGMTTWPLLLKYPWYSVDSSSWTGSVRYAQLQLFDPRAGKMVTVSMRDPKALRANAGLMVAYGVQPTAMMGHNYDRDQVCRVSVQSWQRAEKWLTIRKEMRHGIQADKEVQVRSKPPFARA
jgi:hypothetical protein